MQQLLFEMPPQGKRRSIVKDTLFSIVYEHKGGKLYQGDSTVWLRSLATESVDLIFADPPYNINKAEWDKFSSQEQYIKWSMQ